MIGTLTAANTTLERRALFHFSFKRPGAYTGGRFSSLLDELRGRHTLSDQEWLSARAPTSRSARRRSMRPWVPPAFWEKLSRRMATRLKRYHVAGVGTWRQYN